MSIFRKLFGGQTKESSQFTKPENNIDGSHGDIILKFHQSLQKSIEWNELKNVEFAMWFPSEQDKLFNSSQTKEKWTKIYSITKDYWTYITADLLKTLSIVDKSTFRLGLPDTFEAFAFLTPDGEQVILSLSQEKGIRFHFAETASINFRLFFLDNFISYCNAWKELVELNNGKKDEGLEFENWWLFLIETTIAVEKNEPLTEVGKIVK